MERLENNVAIVSGIISSIFTFSHEVLGEKFYSFYISSNRLSGKPDIIPVIISELLINVNSDFTGKPVTIKGQFRSHNLKEEEKSRLVLSLFAREITFTDNAEFDINDVFLNGYICKKPVLRKTRKEERDVADILLAVNRPYGKSDYIPCICWGRSAMFADSLSVGSKITLWGRIQSREYGKRIDENYERRTAYEISAKRLSLSEE